MIRAAVSPARIALLLAMALGLSGCAGDQDLWERYRAERQLWQARRLLGIASSGVGSAAATQAAAARAAAALEGVVRAFPPARWATVEALRSPRAQDVARLSGTAALLRVALDEHAGRDAATEQGYADCAAAFAAVDSVAVAARAGRARALERLGRDSEAASVWLELAQRAAFPDSAGEAPWALRLMAPAEAVRTLEHAGRRMAADSVRAAASTQMGALARTMTGTPIAEVLWIAIARLWHEAGDFNKARDAVRAALAEPAGRSRRAARVLQLAVLSREAREPDSTLGYSAWAVREFGGAVALEATLELARVWEATGVADSALAVYKQLIEVLPPMGDLAARTRLDRARLLDRMRRWEAARAELRALAMMRPTHPCGEAALVEIVRHHVREGESMFATIETQHAIESFNRMLAMQGNPQVRLETMMARAEVLALMGQPDAALRDYTAAWREQMLLPAAAAAGWRAARLADSSLHNPILARDLYRELAHGAADPETRWRARQHLVDSIAVPKAP